jgi:hypothetical protein
LLQRNPLFTSCLLYLITIHITKILNLAGILYRIHNQGHKFSYLFNKTCLHYENNVLVKYMYVYTRFNRKSSRTRSKKKCWLNLLNFGCHLLRNGLLENVYSDPIFFFFSRSKSTVEVIFLSAVEYRLRYTLDARHCFKTSSLQFHFQFGKRSEITGAKSGE